MNDYNVDTTNPELLLEEELDAQYILTGERTVPPEVVAAARNLARLLIAESPIELARTIAFFAFNGGATPAVGNAMIELLEARIEEATPDELNDIVREAKLADVWTFIKPAIMARNEQVASQVRGYRNMDALEEFLSGLATDGESWLPGPVYMELGDHLRQLAKEADITLLDAIAELAGRWRLKGKIRDALSKRNSQLIASLQASRLGAGYALKKGNKSLLVENPMRALRLMASGYELVEKS